MGPVQAITTGIARSIQFSGRSSRSEFWWYAGFEFLVLSSAFSLFTAVTNEGPYFDFKTTVLSSLFFVTPLAAFVLLPAAMRRLRDSNGTSWAYIIPAVLSSVMSIGILTGFIGLNFAETTGSSQASWSLTHIQSTGLLILCWITMPLQCIWMIGLCLFPTSLGENPYGPNPHEASK